MRMGHEEVSQYLDTGGQGKKKNNDISRGLYGMHIYIYIEREREKERERER